MGTRTWRAITDDLARQIESGELEGGSRLESEDTLALRLGVNRNTAHRALNELQRLGLVTRRRRVGTIVAHRTPNKTNRIAYLVEFAGMPFHSEILRHIEHSIEAPYNLIVSMSKNDPEREAANLLRLREEVDGIICYPASGDTNAGLFNEVAASGYPLVLVDRAPRGCEHLAVLTDNLRAVHDVMGRLIEKGHKRIAFFGGDTDRVQSFRERYEGYATAVAGLGYATRAYERWVPLVLAERPELLSQAIFDALAAMRTLPEPPTAAFCVQDYPAMGLIEACAMQGLHVGSDFDIATYNDFGPMFLRHPGRLYRVLQRADQIGSVAVERLRALMLGESVEAGPVRIPARLVSPRSAETPGH